MQPRCSHCVMLAVIHLPLTTWAAAGVKSPINLQHMLRMNYMQTCRQYLPVMHRCATIYSMIRLLRSLAGCLPLLQLKLTF